MPDRLEIPPQPPFEKADGVTRSERYLKTLCDHSFLSLWSYPGVSRDQRAAKIGDGKELCDLLVVFDNHVIIFSDKDCTFPTSDNPELDWKRWYKRAVLKSAHQVWAAERWIRSFPQRLFLDRACKRAFPIQIPSGPAARFHRVVIAHNVASRCKSYFKGGSGSLMIDSSIIGEMHFADRASGGKPYRIGRIDGTRGYVHVFDDVSLNIVMRTLDTATDFINYLTKKEAFLTGGLRIIAPEEELLARYLGYFNEVGEHDFESLAGFKGVVIEEGHWEKFTKSRERRAQLAADEVSYFWDRLIEKFNYHLIRGTPYASRGDWRVLESSIRLLAREPRTRRRLLAQMLLKMIRDATKTTRSVLVLAPSNEGDPYYVFLLVPEQPPASSMEEYRTSRFQLLHAFCVVTRLKFEDARDIVGIATEAGNPPARSEDLAYFDGRDWNEQIRNEAQRIQNEFHLLENMKRITGEVHDYPEPGPLPECLRNVRRPGRNDPCPCGSGVKYKRCCGG